MYASKSVSNPEPPPYTVSIMDIPQYDAEILLSILCSIGGSPDGPRGAADRIAAALRSVYVTYDDVPRSRGSIFF